MKRITTSHRIAQALNVLDTAGVRKGYRVIIGHRNIDGDWQPSEVERVHYIQNTEDGLWWNVVPNTLPVYRTTAWLDEHLSTTEAEAINRTVSRLDEKRRELESKIDDIKLQSSELQTSTNRPHGYRWDTVHGQRTLVLKK
jgi:hypothetical protein